MSQVRDWPPGSRRVGLFGNAVAVRRLVAGLRRYGVAAEAVVPEGQEGPAAPRSVARWFRWMRRGGFEVVHGLGCFQWWSAWLAARSARIGAVCQWVGSDVLELGAWRRRTRLWRAAMRVGVQVHIANGPWLAAELAEHGVHVCMSNTTAVLTGAESSGSSRDAETALPERFTVLAYLPAGRGELYGEATVAALSREFSDARFVVVGDGHGRFGPNVEHVGYTTDMDGVYAQATVLIRPTRHDGLARMVLEALARGRYVIWTKAMPGVLEARDVGQMAEQLRRVREYSEVNRAGMEYVRRVYGGARVVGRYLRAYEWAARRVGRGGAG